MKIVTIIGARPQFIKAAAVSRAIAAHNRQTLNLDLGTSNIELRTLNFEHSSSVEPRTLNIEHSSFVTPHIPAGNTSAWAQYSLLARDEDHRTALLKKLQDNKIPSAIYYPKPLHMQTAFASLGYEPGAFPVSKDVAGRIFSLPMHPYLSVPDQERITSALTSVPKVG